MRRIWTSTSLVLALVLVALGATAVRPATAGIVDDLWRWSSGPARSVDAASGIDAGAAYIKTLVPRPDQAVLAASASQEGHWRLVNRTGETVTAANPDELARALSVLAPEIAGNTKARLALYVDQDTVFLRNALLLQLPPADLHVVTGQKAFPLDAGQPDTGRRFQFPFAGITSRLILGMEDSAAFDEALAQLTRPLAKAHIRMLALEPGGPATLASSPRIDPVIKRALTDGIDPDRLRYALSSLSGQTALVTGRVQGNLLYFKPSSGPERSLLLDDLIAAAEAADVNLIVLQSPSPRQPGSRNWLWLQVGVANLDTAVEHGRLADFLTALTGESNRMFVVANARSASRTNLELKPVNRDDLFGGRVLNPVASIFNDVLAEVTAKVPVQGITAYMRSSARDRELSRRIIPGIPAWLQIGYAAALLLGLIAWPVVGGWWQRVWPPEQRGEYAQAFGFRAAQIARGSAFLLLFLPLAGPLALFALPFRRFATAPASPARGLKENPEKPLVSGQAPR